MTIEQWVVCFNSYMSVVVLKAPHRMRDLLAYSSLIVKAAHDYSGTPWLSYDSHFRSLAATLQLQNWSMSDQAIWTQYFGRAEPRSQPSNALSVGPYGGTQPSEGRESRAHSPRGKRPKDRKQPYPKQNPICIRWNREGCASPECRYRHVCLECHGPHRAPSCPSSSSANQGSKAKLRDPTRTGGH